MKATPSVGPPAGSGDGSTQAQREVAYQADDAWGAELRRLFGKHAGDVRYTQRGKGEPGSELRRLHDAKMAADRAMRGET